MSKNIISTEIGGKYLTVNKEGYIEVFSSKQELIKYLDKNTLKFNRILKNK